MGIPSTEESRCGVSLVFVRVLFRQIKVDMVYLFEHFELSEKDFCLYQKGERTSLEPKALRVLLLLVGKAGHLVEKGCLLETVWNDAFVEENTLTRMILVLRRALGDNRRDRILIETVPTKGYRFVAEVRQVPEEGDLTQVPAGTLQQAGGMQEVLTKTLENDGRLRSLSDVQRKSIWKSGLLIGAVIAVLVVAAILFLSRHRHKPIALNATDSILLADFTNTTGDPVFDGTLRQGLSVQLEQSPFLSIVSDGRIRQTLKLMGQPADAKLTLALARELCQRAGSEAVLDGSIAQIGTGYR
jgi:eukaryotic-like serine/threonine-protein kinase